MKKAIAEMKGVLGCSVIKGFFDGQNNTDSGCRAEYKSSKISNHPEFAASVYRYRINHYPSQRI